jgi:ABC-type branched-subunit amino acid transport system ATPase component
MTSAPANSLLRIAHLEVRYGDLIGVADVSLEVAAGSVVALLGSNGAGKTTTLNAIAGLVAPSGGAITWRGEAIRDRITRPCVVAGRLVALRQPDRRAEPASRGDDGG